MRKLTGIKAISFDGDGTLWDFEKVMRHSLKHVLSELNQLDPLAASVLNVDKMYYNSMTPADVEKRYLMWRKGEVPASTYEVNCGEDVFTFLERCTIKFSRITIYRFLEHVDMRDVLYFIYLLSTSIEPDGKVDIIVPDYSILAKRILEEDVDRKDFEAENIVTTTELLNEKSCPHASIWTKTRARKFFELEKRFKIDQEFGSGYKFDGRDIYLRFIAKRLRDK